MTATSTFISIIADAAVVATLLATVQEDTIGLDGRSEFILILNAEELHSTEDYIAPWE